MTHPRGRRPIGIQQGPGQGGDNFPIVDPSDDIDRLLADAWLAFVDNTNTFERPFRIKWLHGFGTDIVAVPITPVFTHDLEIVDNQNVTVFSSLAAGVTFGSWDWDSRLKILEWRDGENICRIVYHTEWSPEDTPITYDVYIEPSSAVLDARTVWQYPRRVNNLRVGLTTVQADTVRLQNGFNTDLVVGEPDLTDGERRSTSIVFNAAPNGGSVGRFGPGCDDAVNPAIRRINDIGPQPRGEFQIDASGCYRVQRPILDVLTPGDVREIRVQNHALQIANDCGPCCECDDFINVWEAIRRLRDRYAALIADAQTVRDQYHTNRARWIKNQQCREGDKLRLVVSPICPDELGVAVGYCNNSDVCLENLVIHISFQYEDMTAEPCTKNEVTCEDGPAAGDPIAAVSTVTDDQASVVCQSTFRSGNTNPDGNKGCKGGATPPQREFYRLGGTWPHYWVTWDLVDPGAMATATFRLRFTDVDSEDVIEAIADAFAVGGNLVVSGGSPVPGYVLGEGPVSTPPEMHLVECPKFASTGLNQEPCCESSAPGG